MDKINPSDHITDTDPVDEEVLDISNWYTWQSSVLYDDAQLPFLMAQGWIITATSFTTGGPVDTWYLARRVLKPEYALRDLITSFTNAYNTGRQLNDQRYDEIVAIYTAMLDKTEDELNVLEADDATYEGLIETLITNITSDFTSHNTSVSAALSTFGSAERDRVDTLFDAKLASEQQRLIDNGFYNTTVWTAVSAGIERERAVADYHVEDGISEKQIAHEDRLYVLKTDMRKNIMASRDRLVEALHNRDAARVDMRNQLIKLLNDFMERREDGYPDLSNIGNLTSALGSSGGVALPAPS